MKLIRLLLIFTILLSPLNAFAKDSIHMIIDDFSKPCDPVAANILYNYVLTKFKDAPKLYNKVKKSGKAAASAYRVDLNYDGVDEVIGVFWDTLFCGIHDCSLIILKKIKNGSYENISNMMYSPGSMIKIFNNKRNGYRALWIVNTSTKTSIGALFTGEAYEYVSH